MASSSEGRSGTVQGRLWGVRADDWATIQEQVLRPAYEAALDVLAIVGGTRLLDAGCGAGLLLRLAADRGADAAGVDASEPLLAHARRRIPGAPILHADLEQLPFDDASFDVVTGFNSFQYAADPAAAVREAVRVVRRGGRVLLLTWAPPEQCEAAPYLAAIGRLLPPPPPGAPGPFALSEPGVLTALFEGVGLGVDAIADVSCEWRYPDEETAVAGLLASGPVVRAMEHAGEDAVREAVRAFLRPFRKDDGGYRLTNDFRYVLGTRRAAGPNGPTTTREETTMTRKMVDCRDVPSESGCTLAIAGEQHEILAGAVHHAVTAHGHEDTPELRELIRSGLKDAEGALA